MEVLQKIPQQIINHVKEQGLLHSEIFGSESEAGLKLALTGAVNVVVNTLAELAESVSGRADVWNAVQQVSVLDSATAVPSRAGTPSPRGVELVKSVLDDRYHGTIHTVAANADVQTKTIVQLVEVAAAAALEIIAKMIAENHWNEQELGQWLRKQRVTEAISWPRAAAFAASAASSERTPVAGAATWFARHSSALLVAVGFIAAAELGYFLGTRTKENDAIATSATGNAFTENTANSEGGPNRYGAMPVANLSSPAATAAVAKGGASVPVVLKLKNGLRQVIGANSTESKLYQFLIDPAKEVDLVDPTKGWIGFDRIYFDSNKASLTNESLWQLSNVASILKRFPEAKVKLGGYTDSTGVPLRNLQLSQARARAAMDALVSLGVPADRLTAVGYGVLDNIASNRTEEGRAINRRVSMQVVQK
jgi:OOP family OmpA-OmpF porin